MYETFGFLETQLLPTLVAEKKIYYQNCCHKIYKIVEDVRLIKYIEINLTKR